MATPCHLQTIYPVELTQLILQFLEPRSKLLAARCSNVMLSRASAPFAWKETPLRVEVGDHPDEMVRHIDSCRVLRNAPLHVVYNRTVAFGNPWESIGKFPRLHTLEVFDTAMSCGHLPGEFRRWTDVEKKLILKNWMVLLRLPTVKFVHSLIVHSDLNSSCLYTISRCHALHTLDVRGVGVPFLYTTMASSQAQLTTMRFVHCNIDLPRFDDGLLPTNQCKYLRFLSLEDCTLSPFNFASVCKHSPVLERLTLKSVGWLIHREDRRMNANEKAALAAGCVALACLRALEIVDMAPLDSLHLLPHLSLCPRLDRLLLDYTRVDEIGCQHTMDFVRSSLQHADPKLSIVKIFKKTCFDSTRIFFV